MQITQESIVEQLVTVNITVDAEDYLPEVEKQLKKLGREASIPGFRVGHVPKAFIEKRFKKSIMSDTVFKTVVDSFEKYIGSPEREYQTIGTAALKNAPQDTDFTEDKSFVFTFTINSVPKVDLAKIKTLSVQDYTVKIDNDLVDLYFLDKAVACFSMEPVENDELIEEGKTYRMFVNLKSGEKELSLKNGSAFTLSTLYPKITKPFIGKKQGDIVEIDTKTFLDYQYQMHCGMSILNQKIDSSTVSIELRYIDKYAWEENYVEKMFEQYYPEAENKTEANLRQLIHEDIDKDLKSTISAYNKNRQIPDLLRTLFDIPIPPAGLIEDLKQERGEEGKEKSYIPTAEELESAQKMYKLRYIYKQFMAENNISIGEEEFDTHVTATISGMYKGNTTEEMTKSMKQYIYGNEEMRNRIYFQALNQKLMDSISEQVQLTTPKSISYLEFITLIDTKE